MQQYYTYNKDTGEIGASGYTTYGRSPYVYGNQILVFGKQTYPAFYHNLTTDTLEARPYLAIENETVGINQEFICSTIPEGTVVIVDDEIVGTVDNDGLSLVFPVAKTYTVVLQAPFPYFEKTISIEVTP